MHWLCDTRTYSTYLAIICINSHSYNILSPFVDSIAFVAIEQNSHSILFGFYQAIIGIYIKLCEWCLWPKRSVTKWMCALRKMLYFIVPCHWSDLFLSTIIRIDFYSFSFIAFDDKYTTAICVFCRTRIIHKQTHTDTFGIRMNYFPLAVSYTGTIRHRTTTTKFVFSSICS